MQDEQPAQPLAPVRPDRTARAALFTALLSFLVGVMLAGWIVWRGDFDRFLPSRASLMPAPPQPTSVLRPNASLESLGGMETRLALLEDRLSRIDAEADAASGNAARAEALLIAVAARRTIDRGDPLGPIADQLRLRFGGAQPAAVQAVLDAAAQPVTLAQLDAQLSALTPTLAGEVRGESIWTQTRRELASLFVLKRSAASTTPPQDRIANIRLMLASGRVEEAVSEAERLPGAAEAGPWIAAARRYGAAQRALDVLETTAMLEPRLLGDSDGETVTQPSPLSPPAPAPAEQSPVGPSPAA